MSETNPTPPEPEVDYDEWAEHFNGTMQERVEMMETYGHEYYEGNFRFRGYTWHWDEQGHLTISPERLREASQEDILAALERFKERGREMYLCDLFSVSPVRIFYASDEDLETAANSPLVSGAVRVEICREVRNRQIKARIEQEREEHERELAEYRAEIVKARKRKGHVYLAKADTGHYKIGLSKRPEKRIKHFDTQMPVDVVMVYSFPATDCYAAEKALHEEYADVRVNGEWFDLDLPAVQHIQSIKRWEDGQFLYA